MKKLYNMGNYTFSTKRKRRGKNPNTWQSAVPSWKHLLRYKMSFLLLITLSFYKKPLSLYFARFTSATSFTNGPFLSFAVKWNGFPFVLVTRSIQKLESRRKISADFFLSPPLWFLKFWRANDIFLQGHSILEFSVKFLQIHFPYNCPLGSALFLCYRQGFLAKWQWLLIYITGRWRQNFRFSSGLVTVCRGPMAGEQWEEREMLSSLPCDHHQGIWLITERHVARDCQKNSQYWR